jgi:predicted O-linked N-acetylglucosamine transferase (SPINDLY family)
LRRTIPDVADRVRLLPRMSREDFLRLLAVADVLLDTCPFGGGNTCLEAFAFGAPVVTWPGQLLRGRLTYGLYRQMGLTDCIAKDLDEYVAIALRLGTDPAYRADVRGRILSRKHLIYANAGAVRELECFLAGTVARARSGAD